MFDTEGNFTTFFLYNKFLHFYQYFILLSINKQVDGYILYLASQPKNPDSMYTCSNFTIN